MAANSLSLLADAGHLLTDVVGIGSHCSPSGLRDGRPRWVGRSATCVEIIAAVANAILLFGVAGYVVFEAVRRISDPPDIAAGVMFAGRSSSAEWRAVVLLRDAQRSSLNVRGLSRGARRSLVRRHRCGDCHRADRLGRRRHDRLASSPR